MLAKYKPLCAAPKRL